MRSLFISHTGMTEALGQSQVLPYLVGLAGRGVDVEIVSFEPAGTDASRVDALGAKLRGRGLRWTPLVRAKDTRLVRKVYESCQGVGQGLVAALRRRPNIVHARSYLPAAIADAIATVTPRAKLLFDCRGMLGEEYVDCGHWQRDSLNYRLIKRVESRLFHRSEGMVVLTDRLAKHLREHRMIAPSVELRVIPCCVDTSRFFPDAAARDEQRRLLGLDGRLVVAYSGSLGSYYQEPKMARFVGELVKLGAPVTFLALTRFPTTELEALARAEGLPAASFRAMSVEPADMAKALRVADIGLSFILPSFSKMGSSPTKVAEYLAAGVPIVVNGDIGDQAELSAFPEACVVMPSLSDEDIREAAHRALALASKSYEVRAHATTAVVRAKLGLDEVGIPRYAELYEALVRR